jgi:hypothetical protein
MSPVARSSIVIPSGGPRAFAARVLCGRGTQSRNLSSGTAVETLANFYPSTLSSRNRRDPLKTNGAAPRYPSKLLALRKA